MYEVFVIRDGYCSQEGSGLKTAAGTITLVKGPQNVIIGTGNAWDTKIVLAGLDRHGIKPEKINYVVCCQGTSDFVGNVNLFTNAIHIVCYDICSGDRYQLHQFDKGIAYEIDENLDIVPTPGHTEREVTVVIRGTNKGTIAVTGDLFERFEDLEQPSIWQDDSENPEDQLGNRIELLKMADFIVPGHGSMFKVPEKFKKHGQQVYYEECSVKAVDGKITEAACYSVEDVME